MILKISNSFPTFTYFLIYIFVLQCFCHPASNGNEATSPDDFDMEGKVQEELDAFTEVLNTIPDRDKRNQLTGQLKLLIRKTLRVEKFFYNEGRLVERKNSLDRQKAMLINIMTPLSCGKDLKHHMDTFGIEFFVPNSIILKNSLPLRSALGRIKKTLQDRTIDIYFCTKKLNDLSTEYNKIVVGQMKKKSIWTNKVKEVYRNLAKISIDMSVETDKQAKSNLKNVILKFRSAKNETDAVEKFEKQCKRCHWPHVNFDPLNDYMEYKQLAMDVPKKERQALIRGTEDDTILDEHYRFVTDLFNTRTYFLTNRDRHEACAEVFYFSTSPFLPRLKKLLARQWPQDDFAHQVNNFCSTFASMYDLINITDMHTSAGVFLEINCRHNSTHYHDYIKKLCPISESIEDYKFVCKVLGVIY